VSIEQITSRLVEREPGRVGHGLEGKIERHCRELLEDTIASVGGIAAVLTADSHEQVELVWTTSGCADLALPRFLEEIALDALRAKASVRARAATSECAEINAAECIAVPAFLDDEIVAVVVVLAPEWRLVACTVRLQSLLFPIALVVDRYRTEAALAHRGDELAALRGQLDAYAVDFRSTYESERHRAQQLSAALEELQATYLATVDGLAVAVEAKDECTGGHLQRVCRYGMMLTNLVAPGHANDPQFEYGFLLHDIGKLTVPDQILMKPGPLDDAEWKLMQEHPDSGRSILSGIPFLAGAREIVYAHHERWDGHGYPRGLAGEAIPLGAQIFPVCDAFDAMTSDRPYRRALSTDEARREIRGGSGTQFRPEVVEAFLSLPFADLDAVRTASRNGWVH
jgi:ribonuclease P protein subunit RPR2